MPARNRGVARRVSSARGRGRGGVSKPVSRGRGRAPRADRRARLGFNASATRSSTRLSSRAATTVTSIDNPEAVAEETFYAADGDPVRCVCGTADEDGRQFIQCDECGIWQHVDCMGVEDTEQPYQCDMCEAKDIKAKMDVKAALNSETDGNAAGESGAQMKTAGSGGESNDGADGKTHPLAENTETEDTVMGEVGEDAAVEQQDVDEEMEEQTFEVSLSASVMALFGGPDVDGNLDGASDIPIADNMEREADTKLGSGQMRDMGIANTEYQTAENLDSESVDAMQVEEPEDTRLVSVSEMVTNNAEDLETNLIVAAPCEDEPAPTQSLKPHSSDTNMNSESCPVSSNQLPEWFNDSDPVLFSYSNVLVGSGKPKTTERSADTIAEPPLAGSLTVSEIEGTMWRSYLIIGRDLTKWISDDITMSWRERINTLYGFMRDFERMDNL